MTRFMLLALFVTACAKPDAYVCAVNADCGAGAFCERDGGCSIADASCPSGRRYSDIAGGAHAGTCVDATSSPLDESALCNVTAARPTATPDSCAERVCGDEPMCCSISWDQQCVRLAESRCDLDCGPEIIAAGGFRLAAAFALDTPMDRLWSEIHTSWNHVPAWGDIDGDGLPDLAMGREANADGPGLQIYQNSGIANGKFQLTAVTVAGDPIDTIRMLWWRDFDADGDLDLLASGKGIYLIVTQNGTFTSHRLTPTNADVNATWLNTSSAPPWRIGAANEMAMDVVTYSISEGFALSSATSLGFGEGAITWCNVGGTPARDVIVGNRIFIANATGFAAPSNASGAGYLPSCVDLDNDNDNDLVLGDYGTVRIIINNGGLATPPIEFPINLPDYFGIADFDDDGRIDILVSSAEASDNMKQIPLRMLENRTTGFELRAILPDWNTPELDSRGLDIAYVPEE